MKSANDLAKIEAEITGQLTNNQDLHDIKAGAVTVSLIEALAQQMIGNYGQANQIFMSTASFQGLANRLGQWAMYPQYETLPWAYYSKLTKREKKVAELHKLLFKLKVTTNEEDNKWTCEKACKRLKRAKWARYTKEYKCR